jgi:hypothetical protein
MSEATMDSKRHMRRSYKETMVPAGVFVITNTLNGRTLVGASMNVDGAINRNRFELEHQTHRNAALLCDWNQFGAENFSFDRVETMRARDDPAFDYKAELEVMLQLWCDEYECFGAKGYNRR